MFAKNCFSEDRFISFLKKKFYTDFKLNLDIGEVDLTYKNIKIKKIKNIR